MHGPTIKSAIFAEGAGECGVHAPGLGATSPDNSATLLTNVTVRNVALSALNLYRPAAVIDE
jgi:hypothetical protein